MATKRAILKNNQSDKDSNCSIPSALALSSEKNVKLIVKKTVIGEDDGEVKKRVKKRYIFLREMTVIAVGLAAYAVYLFLTRKLAPIVQISTGQISGRTAVSRGGRPFYEYLGIPYAQPPVGNLRFRSPLPPTKWTGIRDGTQEGPYCLQIDLLPRIRRGDEDCLYLNVFTPVLPVLSRDNESQTVQRTVKKKLVPVLVFFHGGGFVSGGLENFGAHYFMDEDAILVTLHYRLGIFGFLNTGDTMARGNMGLKDQVAALQWIQQNIMQFGGDPNQVTIFGESAGAASVHFHMLSPMSKGLFHKGISQSATSLLHYIFNKSTNNQNQILSEQTGCTMKSTIEFVECLRKQDAVKLVELQRGLINPPRNPQNMFLPSKESVADSDAFLTEEPIKLLRNGTFTRLPWMTGVNAEDGLLLSAELMTHPSKLGEIADDWQKMAEYIQVPANLTLVNQIRDFYFTKSFDFRSVSLSNVEALEPLTHLYSDRVFFVSNHLAAVIQSKYSPVYLYYYTHQFQISMIDIMKAVRAADSGIMMYEFVVLFAKDWIYRTLLDWNPRFPGVAHAEEMLCQFSILPLPHISSPSGSEDYLMSRELIKTWVQFASDHKSLSFGNVTWNTVSSSDEGPMYMNLNISNPSMMAEPFHQRTNFWKSIGIY